MISHPSYACLRMLRIPKALTCCGYSDKELEFHTIDYFMKANTANKGRIEGYQWICKWEYMWYEVNLDLCVGPNSVSAVPTNALNAPANLVSGLVLSTTFREKKPRSLLHCSSVVSSVVHIRVAISNVNADADTDIETPVLISKTNFLIFASWIFKSWYAVQI